MNGGSPLLDSAADNAVEPQPQLQPIPPPLPIQTQPPQGRTMTVTRIHASHRGEVMLMCYVLAPPTDNRDKAKPGIQSIYLLWMNSNLTPVGEDMEPEHVDVAPISLSPCSAPSLPPHCGIHQAHCICSIVLDHDARRAAACAEEARPRRCGRGAPQWTVGGRAAAAGPRRRLVTRHQHHDATAAAMSIADPKVTPAATPAPVQDRGVGINPSMSVS